MTSFKEIQIVVRARIGDNGEVDWISTESLNQIETNVLRKIWLYGCKYLGIQVDEPKKIKWREFI